MPREFYRDFPNGALEAQIGKVAKPGQPFSPQGWCVFSDVIIEASPGLKDVLRLHPECALVVRKDDSGFHGTRRQHGIQVPVPEPRQIR